MALPFCKLIALTGPDGGPDRLVLSTIEIIQGSEQRVERRRPTLVQGEADFDDQDFIPFANPVQVKLGLNVLGGAHDDLGLVIISADDVNKGEKKQKFGLVGVASLYELTYKVL
jgi:hypothetical protein